MLAAALTLTAHAVLATPTAQTPPSPEIRMTRQLELKSIFDDEPRLLLIVPEAKLRTSKISPQHNWVFEWQVSGLGWRPGRPQQWDLRTRVFSQFRRSENDVSFGVLRMMMRLWDFNIQRLRFDHGEQFPLRSVDVYLCFGGEAGGEQRFDVDEQEKDQNGRPSRVNTIYIYQIESFTKPIEMAREIAHEYGHATLPHVGRYPKSVDTWADGDFGERLYLRWFRDAMAAGKLEPIDVMGATQADLDAYLKVYSDPLIEAGALRGPDDAALAGDDQKAMDAFLSVALWADRMLPIEIFRRSLLLNPNRSGPGFVKALVEAAAEAPEWKVTIPAEFRGKAIWIPLGKGTVSGARVLSRRGDWAKIQPTAAAVTVKNPPVE